MVVEIISVGDELLNGMTVNTNAAFIADRLHRLGYFVFQITAVGDHEKNIANALKRAGEQADVVILTGGLGVTHDDITKKTAASYFGKELVISQRMMDRIDAYFKQSGKKVSVVNREQAKVLKDTEIIENPIGLAPGFIVKQGNCTYFFLPGVPSEMKVMLEKGIVPRLNPSGQKPGVSSMILKTTGIAESVLYTKLINFQKQFPEIKLAYLPETPGVKLRLSVSNKSSQIRKDNRLRDAVDYIIRRAGLYIYGEDETTIEQSVADLLFQKKLTIAVAESCTGGLISHKLTQISGSSQYFNRGVVAYSNEAKVEILNVSPETIDQYGAVSRETVLEMAQGVRQISETDIGLSTTGIAGPTGGTQEKPVGLVFIGYASSEMTLVEKHHFSRERWWNKERTAVTALDLVRRALSGITKDST